MSDGPASKKAKMSVPLLPNGNADLPSPAPPHEKYVDFDGKLLLIGFGSIGSGTLPLIIKHINMPANKITVLTGDDCQKNVEIAAKRYGVNFQIGKLTVDNYKDMLTPLLSKGDFCVNVSVDVGSCDMLTFCNENQVLYIDTVVEPWLGGYFDQNLTPSQRSNYQQREEMLILKNKFGPDAPTAVVTHGANPGMVSHFVKQALLNIAKDTGVELKEQPSTKEGWAKLSQTLGVKTIHIAERDTQESATQPKKHGEFLNTWSVDGFISEGCQPSELGWGTHEKELPPDGAHHTFGTDSAIYLNRPGANTKVRTWTPTEGNFHGFLVTHNESISIADYFTVHGEKGAEYRPTVHYAYHPADCAVLSLIELAGKNYNEQKMKRVMIDEISSGIDELGVLLCGHAKGAYWYGSQLEIEMSRKLIEGASATSLQVTATVLAGVVWAIKNPRKGIKEPEELDHKAILDIVNPYVVPVVGEYTDWNPLYQRNTLFKEDLDLEDPWQFKNVRVV